MKISLNRNLLSSIWVKDKPFVGMGRLFIYFCEAVMIFGAFWVWFPSPVVFPGLVNDSGQFMLFTMGLVALSAMISRVILYGTKIFPDREMLLPSTVYGVVAMMGLILGQQNSYLLGTTGNWSTAGLNIIGAIIVMYYVAAFFQRPVKWNAMASALILGLVFTLIISLINLEYFSYLQPFNYILVFGLAWYIFDTKNSFGKFAALLLIPVPLVTAVLQLFRFDLAMLQTQSNVDQITQAPGVILILFMIASVLMLIYRLIKKSDTATILLISGMVMVIMAVLTKDQFFYPLVNSWWLMMAMISARISARPKTRIKVDLRRSDWKLLAVVTVAVISCLLFFLTRNLFIEQVI